MNVRQLAHKEFLVRVPFPKLLNKLVLIFCNFEVQKVEVWYFPSDCDDKIRNVIA